MYTASPPEENGFKILQMGVAASLPPVILAEGASIVAFIISLNLELGAQVVVVL